MICVFGWTSSYRWCSYLWRKAKAEFEDINVSSFLKKADIAKLESRSTKRTAVNGAIVGHSAIEIAESWP